jgi:ribosomal protein L11 methyltransferase
MIDSGLMIEDANEIDKMDTCYGELLDESMNTADRSVGAVSVYVADEKNPAESVSFLKERLALTGIEYELTLSGMQEEDWANTWKQYYKPIRIAHRLMVVPTWEEYEPKEGDLILRMDPGMAFGTGTHETTRLCATLTEDYMKPGARVLDVGTGSGILAIAASKLGAGEVKAYDIDPVAVRVAQENCDVNGCDNVTCGISDLLAGVDTKGGLYDFVCANIVAGVLVQLMPVIPHFLRENAHFLCSGILADREEEVRLAAQQAGLEITQAFREDGWCCLLGRKKP